MAVWTTIREFYDKLTAHTGYWGRAWVAILFTLRLFSVVTVGTSVYGDDLSAFRCDTQQPGCSNTCFNHFSPISHIRLLAFQIIFVMIPFVTFYFFTERWRDAIKDAESETKQYPQEIKKQNSGKDYLIEASKANQIEIAISKREQLMKRVQITYIISCTLTVIVEIVFIYLLLYVQLEAHVSMNLDHYRERVVHFFPPMHILKGYLPRILNVPEYYKCRHSELRKLLGHEYISPCSQGKDVPCYVARAKEKTLWSRGFYCKEVSHFIT